MSIPLKVASFLSFSSKAPCNISCFYWRCNLVRVMVSSMASVGFVTVDFPLDGVVSPTLNPQRLGPGSTLHLAPTLCPVWHRWPYQELTLPPA
jgi:hypothetical protein